MASELCMRGAGVLSVQRDAPVTASGCKQQSCRSIEAVPVREQ